MHSSSIFLDPTIANAVRTIFDRMELAGEAGSLLDIEGVVRAGLRTTGSSGEMFAAIDEERWRDAERAVHDVLLVFALIAQRAGQQRRSLFVDDVAHGFAFIDATRQQYDVVLMNPPFGEPTKSAEIVSGVELATATQ